jgi:hypothetical protein
MNTNETIKATGRLNIQILGPDGNIKDSQNVDNLVVTTGLNFIASRMRDASATVMSHMAVGSGTSAAIAGNTTLGTELSRVALSSTTNTNNSVAYTATFGTGVGTGAITEAGLFSASTGGTMLCRTVFSVVNKEAGDTMVVTWTVTIGAT